MKKRFFVNASQFQQKLLAVAFVSMSLSACGGGGGSNGTVPSTPVTPTEPPPTPVTPTEPPLPAGTPFTSWSDVQAGSTVVVPGMSQEVIQTTANGLVTSISTPTVVDTATSAFTETLNASGELTTFVITSPAGSVSFDTSVGDNIGVLAIDNTIIAAVKPDSSSLALAADPSKFGWEYQSFGVWSTDRTSSSSRAGVMSVGAPTAGAAIPTSGTATFTGKSIGYYADATGLGHSAYSDLSVNVDFAARTLALSSTGTVKTHDYQTTSPASNLNLTGTLTYAAGTNSFAGLLTTNGGTLTGASSGRFYGPSAEELGGVFNLKAGSGVETYGGAYGAKRP